MEGLGGDIPQRFYGPARATFMATQHGDFIVLTYKKKETKNYIDNSSYEPIGTGVLLITFVFARSG
jgi:hypothetical protein